MLAPAFYDTPDEVLGTFLPDVFKLESMKEQCDDIIIYHSIDDESVPFSDSENYLQLFPNATFRKFTDK
jgi:predicted alpha/beta hydrolase family esterase